MPARLNSLQKASMKARRTSGFDIQSDSTGGALPARAALSLYPEALKKLPTGVLLLLLDDRMKDVSHRFNIQSEHHQFRRVWG